jgi:hypothetical protein
MITKTRAVDADGRKLRILEPVYFYIKTEMEGDFRVLSRIQVGLSGMQVPGASDAQHEDPNVYGKGRWHCFLMDEKTDYVDQCDAKSLTTKTETALKLLANHYQKHLDRAHRKLSDAKSVVDQRLEDIKAIKRVYALQCRKLRKA